MSAEELQDIKNLKTEFEKVVKECRAIKWLKISLYFYPIVLVLCLALHFILIDHVRPDYTSCSMEADSIRMIYHKVQSRVEGIKCDEVRFDDGLKRNDLLKVLQAMKQRHLKDSLSNVVARVRLDFLERDMLAECDKMHADYSAYLIQLQTWTAILVGVIALITMVIGYVIKSDVTDRMKDYESRFEKYREESKKGLESVKNREFELKEEMKEAKLLLQKEIESAKSLNRCSLLLSSIKAMNYDVTCFAALDTKIIVRNLLEELRELSQGLKEAISSKESEEEWKLDLKCILINYLSVVSELELIITSNYNAFSASAEFKGKILGIFEKWEELEREEVVLFLGKVSQYLYNIEVEMTIDINEHLKSAH